jgi:8-oxo-dGTP pyrophosphatase MutT (NUDIX family)
VEFGERLADALRREVREEYGIKIAVGELLDVADHILAAERQHWVSPSYICRILSGTLSIRESGKCSAIAWFAPDDVTGRAKWHPGSEVNGAVLRQIFRPHRPKSLPKDADRNTYTVVAVNGAGRSAPSLRVGGFSFSLTPGTS